MALWQRDIGQLPPNGLRGPDASADRSRRSACWRILTISSLPRTAPPCCAAVAQRTLDALRRGSATMRRAWKGAAFTRRTGAIRWKTPPSTLARAKWMADRTLRNTGCEPPPHAASSGADTASWSISPPRSFLAVQNIGNSAVPGSRIIRISSNPFCAASITLRHSAPPTVSKPIAKAPPSSSRAELNIQTATPGYSCWHRLHGSSRRKLLAIANDAPVTLDSRPCC